MLILLSLYDDYRIHNDPSRKNANLESILFVVFTSFEPRDEKLYDEGQAGDDETQQEQQQRGLHTHGREIIL